jgi:adenylate cyclase
MTQQPAPHRADKAQRVLTFLSELRRRKVYISVVAYVAIAVAVVELGGAIVDALHLPDVTPRVLTVLLMLGFPVVVVLAWIFDLTTEGVRRTEPRSATSPAQDTPAGSGTARAPSTRATGLARVPEPLPAVPAATARAKIARARAGEPTAGEGAVPDAGRVERAALGHVRHELRTPVNGIIGYAEMLLEDAGDLAIEGDLRRIRSAGAALLSRIDEVLGAEAPRPDGAGPELDALAARVHAELRTPINTVMGYAELLIETCREQSRDELVPDLERILAAAKRLLQASGDIVGIATGGGADAVSAETSAMTRQVLAGIRPVEPGSMVVDGEGTVLVVDDNAMNRDLLLRQLARTGYIVDTASDGLEALERLANRSYDVVLLDVIMPGLDGVETLRRIRANGRLDDVPVLMLSSLDEVDSAIRCIEIGAEEYLSKPFEPTLLAARIAANVALRRMRARDRAYTQHLDASREAVERLTRAAFPSAVADRVLRGETGIMDGVAAATVVACELHRSARAGTPAELVERLDDLAACLEEVCEGRAVDAVVARPYGATILVGFPAPSADHAATAADLATELLRAAPDCAIGLHSGAVTGGVVGRTRPRYDAWGETVETAEALARAAGAGSAVLSPTTQAQIRDRHNLRSGSVMEVPGHGHMKTWVLQANEAVPLTG